MVCLEIDMAKDKNHYFWYWSEYVDYDFIEFGDFSCFDSPDKIFAYSGCSPSAY